MPITIKSESEIKKMRIAGEITGKALEVAEKNIRVGMTTHELDKIIENHIRSCNAVPGFLNYRGYPASSCISINEEVIHGIPGERKLKAGDVVSVDVGAVFGGYYGDAARTFILGETSDENKKLVEITRQSFFEGIKFAKQGCHLFEISEAIQDYVEKNGFSVVKDYVGHGIGTNMHEAPEIPNYKQNRRGPKLTAGMTLAIEPMVNIGTDRVISLGDGWTVITADKKCSAHYENTILICDGEPEILTMV